VIEEVAAHCVECGFCEPVCPSRNVTTTPRQRIVLRREMARQEEGSPVYEALLREYEYDAIQTCAADGTCAPSCPLAIDTGQMIKEFRARERTEREERVGLELAKRWSVVEAGARAGLRVPGAGVVANALRKRVSEELIPSFPDDMPPPAPALPSTSREGAAAVYMPACINRIFGNPDGRPQRPSLPEAFVEVSKRAGLPLWIPDDAAGNCCAVPWSSKGYTRGKELMSQRVRESIMRWTDGGELPFVIDASSCAHGLVQDAGTNGLEVLDSIAWVHDHLLPKLEVKRRVGSVAVHPTCSAGHMHIATKLDAVARELADEVVVPVGTTCCGMAGDRGLLHPELPRSALRDVKAELDGRSLDACMSSNRTCELALQQVTGRPYSSFVFLLEELTR
jgi:D-lactate dehydrogenase